MKDGSFSGSDDSMYYLLAADGLYLTRRSKFFTTELRVQGLPWLENHGERVQLHLPRPLPDSILEQAVAFFLAVFERFGSEAILLLYYASDGDRYELIAPRQEVAPLTCHYDIQPTPPGWLRVGSLHSHGSLEAGHSDIDARDEQHEDGLHFTVGNLQGTPSMSCELVIDGRRFEVPVPEVPPSTSCVEVPEEWLGAVSGNKRA